MKDKIKNKIKRFLGRFRTKLPQGRAEFEVWANDVLDTYGVPNNEINKGVLCAMIINQEKFLGFAPKKYFGYALYSAAAKQLAGTIFTEIKHKQQAEAKEAAEKAKAEATAKSEVASNESKVSN